MTAPREVLIVGLGAVAASHSAALETIADVAVIAGIDKGSRRTLKLRGAEVPVYARVRDAISRHDPSHVVITTPTPTHAAVCDEVVESFPAADLLVEKPAADNLADACRILCDMGDKQAVNVAYHMAFSPEVTWGARLAEARSESLGPPVGIVASFSDPYEAERRAAQARLGNSWIDSGINALSVLNRFAEPLERTSLRPIGPAEWSAFEARLTCRAGTSQFEALIVTSWHVTASARSTRITYGSGAELVLDHHGVAGYLIENGAISEFFGSDGQIPRQESHYRALYQWYLAERRRTMPADRSLHLHELLLRTEEHTQGRRAPRPGEAGRPSGAGGQSASSGSVQVSWMTPSQPSYQPRPCLSCWSAARSVGAMRVAWQPRRCWGTRTLGW